MADPLDHNNQQAGLLLTALRAAGLMAHLVNACCLFFSRIVVNRFRAHPRPSARIFGRTLAELFEKLGPTYVKLGQILSTRRDLLNPLLVEDLEQLQDNLSPAPFTIVPALFQRELGVKIEDVFAEFPEAPIASASVSTVYGCRLRNGRKVAVKVRRPGVVRQAAADLRLIRSLAAFLGKVPPFRHIPVRRAATPVSR